METMYRVCRKTYPTPKQTRKNVQKQNATAFFCGLVAPYKPPYPHKDKKVNCPFIIMKARGSRRATVSKRHKAGFALTVCSNKNSRQR